MLIDWFTLGAQVVNFLILVVLLRLFLYKPIIEAMDKREEKIASRLEEARQKREQAEEEAQQYRERQQKFDRERQELLTKAHNEAQEQRQKLISQAREEVNEARKAWQQAVQREKETFLRRLRDRASKEVFALVQRALRDLANADLEQELIRNFQRELATLDEKSREAVLRDSDQTYEIHSAFALSQSQREGLHETISEQFGEVDVHFVTESDLVCGVALVTDARRIGWNVRDYLHTMEDHLEALLQEQALPETGEDSTKSNESAGSSERVATPANQQEQH